MKFRRTLTIAPNIQDIVNDLFSFSRRVPLWKTQQMRLCSHLHFSRLQQSVERWRQDDVILEWPCSRASFSRRATLILTFTFNRQNYSRTGNRFRSRKIFGIFFRIFAGSKNFRVILKLRKDLVYLYHGEKGKQDWICINWLII